jgi:hypothetical protein
MTEREQAATKERMGVPEPDCDAAADPEAAGVAPEEVESVADDALDEPFEEEGRRFLTRPTKAAFLKPGGSWGGSVHPARRALRIGQANGLTVTSRKRSWGSTGSDHNVAQKRSFAVDLSNGSSPTKEMDRTAYEIATILGHPQWRSGILNERVGNVRMQLIWRWEGHYNHVHVGVRVD